MIPILLANLFSMALTPRTPPRRLLAPGRARKGPAKPINLALQGGGAHGAFTWGVLDQLLEDGRVEIEGISGASAGAVNAIMLADGLIHRGADEARQPLPRFFRAGRGGGPPPPLPRAVGGPAFPFPSRQGVWRRAVGGTVFPLHAQSPH